MFHSWIYSSSTFIMILIILTSLTLSLPAKGFRTWTEFQEALKPKPTELRKALRDKCAYGGELRDFCEKCAKVSKNEIVFPLCCKNEEGVGDWCNDYLEYKLSP